MRGAASDSWVTPERRSVAVLLGWVTDNSGSRAFKERRAVERLVPIQLCFEQYSDISESSEMSGGLRADRFHSPPP